MSTVLNDSEAKALIGSNVRRILEQRGMTKYHLAKSIGEHESTVGRIANGIHCPGAGLLARIAEALDVKIDELFSPKKNSAKSA